MKAFCYAMAGCTVRIIEKQLPINISNISLMTKEGEKTRIGYKNEDGKKVRISTKSKETI